MKCTGLYEYPGEVLEFVDQVAQFKKVKDGEYSSVNELPSNISTGEENSGIRLCKLPVPDNIDKTIALIRIIRLFVLLKSIICLLNVNIEAAIKKKQPIFSMPAMKREKI